MAEPFELIDEWELSIYEVVIKQLRRQFGDVVNADFFSGGYFAQEAERMAAELTPILGDILREGMVMSLPGDMTPLVAAAFDDMKTYAAQHSATLIRRINDTTEQRVNELVQQSIIDGWSIDELTENLSPWFSEVRARRIAVTETTNAYIGGAEIGMNELRGQGLNMVARWLTANDDRVCPICAPRHLKLRGDGWSDMSAAHIGCRCDVAIEEMPLDAVVEERMEDLSGYDGSVRFGTRNETVIGSSLHGGDIVINENFWRNASEDEKRFLLGHEVAHSTIENFILTNQNEWNLAEEVLTIELNERSPSGRIFVGGHARIGESMADILGSVIGNTIDTAKPLNISVDKWNEIINWATDAIQRGGYSISRLHKDIEKIIRALDAAL